MANTPPRLVLRAASPAVIRPHRFVKIDVNFDHAGLEADANERVIGIAAIETNQPPLSDIVTTSIHAAGPGQAIHLYGDGDESALLELGGTVVRGDRLKSDADGKGVQVATTGTTIQHWGAIALASGVSGELIPVQVQIGSERPALS
jgi:hypothetical protein